MRKFDLKEIFKVNKFISGLKKCVSIFYDGEQLFIVKDFDVIHDVMKLSYLYFEKFKQKINLFNVG